MDKKSKVFVYKNGDFAESPQDIYNDGFYNGIKKYNETFSKTLKKEIKTMSRGLSEELSARFIDCIVYIANQYAEENPDLAWEIIELAQEYFEQY